MPGLIFFGFPQASYGEWNAHLLSPQQIGTLSAKNAKEKIISNGLMSDKLDIFFNKNFEREDMIILFYKLK